MAATANHDREQFTNVVRLSVRIIMLLSLPAAIGLLVSAASLLEFLQYGNQFRSSVPLIMILALHVPLVGLDMVLANALNATDGQRAWALVGVSAALINPALNLLLIPLAVSGFENGAIGAASATVVTELFIMTVGLRMTKGAVLNRRDFVFVAKILLACGLMAAVVIGVEPSLGLPAGAFVGLLTYVAASKQLRVLSCEDVELLKASLRRRAIRGTASA
jgi:O-antigen/teichoic acid export membrane protein